MGLEAQVAGFPCLEPSNLSQTWSWATSSEPDQVLSHLGFPVILCASKTQRFDGGAFLALLIVVCPAGAQSREQRAAFMGMGWLQVHLHIRHPNLHPELHLLLIKYSGLEGRADRD